MYIFIAALVAGHRKRGYVRVLTAAQPSQFFWWALNLIVRSYGVVSASTFLLTAHYPPILCTKITPKWSTQKLEIHVTATEMCIQCAISKERPPQKCHSCSYTICEHSGWIWCAISTFYSCWELFLWHKTTVNNTVNLGNYLSFCDNIMCSAGPNNNLW